MRLSPRLVFALIGALSIGVLGFGYYLQFARDLDPCPMCIFQRLCYLAVAITAISASLHGPQRVGGMIYSLITMTMSVIGGGIAARQTWLQHLPADQVPECGPGLEFMLDMYPILETIEMALKGTGECAEVVWQFLGLSIPEWSLVCFFGLVIVSGWQCIRYIRIG